MKNKKSLYFISLSLIVSLFLGCNTNTNISNLNKATSSLLNNKIESNLYDKIEILDYCDVKDSLIRFHVIANSDTVEDQKLKLKVRDAVLDYLYPSLNKSKSLSETRNILNNNKDKVLNIANEVIRENSYNYKVYVQLSKENFPEKSYGNLILPQGKYEAFRIIIGSGQGHNWWCVMFPPLCFVDESKAVVEYDKTENKIKTNINKSKNNSKNAKKSSDKDNTNRTSKKRIEYKSKLLEIIQGL